MTLTMPELPEVEIVKQGLEQVLIGDVIKDIAVNRRDLRRPIPKNFEKILKNTCVETISRRGKYILISFLPLSKDNQNESKSSKNKSKNSSNKNVSSNSLKQSAHIVVVMHLGMSGRVYIYGQKESYKKQKHDHVLLETQKGLKIVFNDPRRFGFIDISYENKWLQEKPFDQMGAEPLDNHFNGPHLFQILKNKKTPIKTALLDQNIVAGIGNIYACEALYKAKINPASIANDLEPKAIEDLVLAIKDVLQKAILAGGSTLKDYQHVDGTLGYFQHQFCVYDQEGNACSDCDCKEGIKRIIQAGRSTFYCSKKQVR